MAKITLNETAQKCNHILLNINKRLVITTKQELTNAGIRSKGDASEIILFNQLKRRIRSYGLTSWSQIKTAVELEDFKL